MSDPTVPPSENDRMNDVPAENTSEGGSEPIDVTELLESTRKLFEPEALQRSMEQAGYTPEFPAEPPEESGRGATPRDESLPPDTPHQLIGEPHSDSLPYALAVDSTVDTEETADATVDESTRGDVFPEEPPLRGFNVLSIVAIILALALSPLAVVFGYIALGQTRRAHQRGETLALWAIGLGWVVFAAWVVLIVSLLWIGYERGITVDSLREFIELFSLP